MAAAAINTQDLQTEENNDNEKQSAKEVLIRNSDMSPEEECVIISVSNSAIEEVADIQGIF